MKEQKDFWTDKKCKNCKKQIDCVSAKIKRCLYCLESLELTKTRLNAGT